MSFSDWRSLSMEILLDAAKDIKPDLIIYAGDDTIRFSSKEQQNNHENIFSLLSKHAKYGILAVIGNDCLKEHKKIITDGGAIDLHEKSMIFENIGFIGIEGGTKDTEIPIGSVLYSDKEIEKHLIAQFKQVSKCNKMVVVSHNPPYGILDFGLRFTHGQIGSRAIRKFIQSHKKVVLNVCGHAHCCGGSDKKPSEFDSLSVELIHCHFVNVASHDDGDAEPNIAIITISEDSKEVKIEWYVEEIRKIPQVGPNTAERLRKEGIRTFSDFEKELDGKIKTFPGVYDWHINFWKRFFLAKKKGVILSIEPFIFEKRAIFVDIETDDKQLIIWLIGVYNKEKEEFVQFFEKNPKNEKENLRRFYDYLKENKFPQIIEFSNCKLEERALTERMRKYGILKNHEKMNTIDLGLWVQTRVSGTQNLQLKTLASALGYEFKHRDITGFEVGLQYSIYVQNPKNSVDWEKLLEYNRDDVMSMPFLVKKINESYKKYVELKS